MEFFRLQDDRGMSIKPCSILSLHSYSKSSIHEKLSPLFTALFVPKLTMAFEFFDDVAFYYVVQSILALYLLPSSIYYGWVLLKRVLGSSQYQSAAKCSCATCEKKFLETEAQRNKLHKQITPCRVLYVILLIFFLIGLSQLHNYKTEEMATFDPFTILELPEDATEKQIKKAFRDLSRMHHPDKGGDDKKFMMIAKAYATLTDAVAKENLKKYGNPDGYQGASVTIGLPSWLTKKENEMKVMFVYVLVLLIIPPIAVGIWYAKSKQFHESGVMHTTLRYYYNYIQDTSMLKNLIEVLALSHEYFPLNTMKLDTEEFKKLNKDLKEEMGKFKHAEKAVYVKRAVVMLYAHMMQKEIVDSLKPDLHFVLERAHKLLDAMFEMTLSRRFFRPVIDIYLLTQLITQGMWREDSPLMQLPYMGANEVMAARKKKINTLQELRNFLQETQDSEGESKRAKIFKDITPGQWKEIEQVLGALPRISLEYSYEVEGEEGLYEGDFVLLKAKIQRLQPQEQDQAPKLTAKPKEEEDAESPKPQAEGSNGEGMGLGAVEDVANGTAAGEMVEKEKKVRPKLSEEELDEKIWAASITPEKKKVAEQEMVPYVHSARFPFPKQEKWICYLVEAGGTHGQGRIAALVKVPNLVDQEEVELRFRPAKAGKSIYELHLRCDSYMGVDVVETFKVIVGKAKEAKKARKRAAGAPGGPPTGEDDDMDSEEEEEEEEVELPGKWYYLQGSTLLEGIVHWIALGVLLVMLQNFLHTRGLWDPYFAPIINRLYEIYIPLWNTVHGVIGPVYDPACAILGKTFSAIAEFLTRELSEEAIKAKKENFRG
eukprot:g24406.t1